MGKIKEDINKKERLDSIGGIDETHPSFGIMSFSRASYSKSVSLFGSSIKNRSTITLKISNASKNRGLNYDTYSSVGQDDIVEVEMSASQFAEAITSLNCGEGIPCTIRRVGEDIIVGAEEETKTELHKKEYEESLRKATEEIKKAYTDTINIFSQKSIKKADKEAVLHNMFRFIQFADSNSKFYLDQFNERMDKTVVEAKSEVANFISDVVTKKGLQELWEGGVEDNKKLEE